MSRRSPLDRIPENSIGLNCPSGMFFRSPVRITLRVISPLKIQVRPDEFPENVLPLKHFLRISAGGLVGEYDAQRVLRVGKKPVHRRNGSTLEFHRLENC
ncbi:hypothetical protein [Streptomyces sp. ML-6]|uniref:hypothetical protein n=1 Tax=Streptomyces sp. ML-6 TaxID=2982693 RepID=UPI0024C080D8|nr:hypothetical protein [Streptomyces sp. ML-6]MDK0520596.1 hypothetical protein [Streptomyces sp. ML-6]